MLLVTTYAQQVHRYKDPELTYFLSLLSLAKVLSEYTGKSGVVIETVLVKV